MTDAAEEQEEERNPSITNLQWKNADGEPITKALVGDEVTLCADVQDIPDGTSAKIKIVEKDADSNDDGVTTLTAAVSGGRIECAWKVVYMEDDDDVDSEQEKAEKGYTLPEYAFTVECGGATSEESGQLDVMGWIKAQILYQGTQIPALNHIYRIKQQGSIIAQGVTDENGFIFVPFLDIGSYEIEVEY